MKEKDLVTGDNKNLNVPCDTSFDSSNSISKELFKALEALCDMWSQYCPPPTGHVFMSAGENCADVLDKYKLLKNDKGYGGEVDYERLEELRLLFNSTPNDKRSATSGDAQRTEP